MANVNDKLKELEEQAKKKADQNEVKKIQQSAQAVQQKLSSNPSAVGTVNNNTYTPVTSSAGNVVKKTGTQVVTGIPTVNQQKAYNDVFTSTPATSTRSQKEELISGRASLNNAINTLGNIYNTNLSNMKNTSSNGYSDYVNNLYRNNGASMSEKDYQDLKKRTSQEVYDAKNKGRLPDESVKQAEQLMSAYRGQKKENEQVARETANVKLDTDANGNTITKYLNEKELSELNALQSLVDSNEADFLTKEQKKRYEELKEKELKEKKANNLLENYYYGDNYKNLTDEEKQSYLSDIGSRHSSFVERYGKTLAKNGLEMVATPFKVADAIRNTQNDIDLQEVEDMFISGQISEDEYKYLTESLQFDLNDENNLAKKLSDDSKRLSTEAYNGLNSGQNVVLQTLDSTTNFLMNFYSTADVGGFMGLSDDAVGNLVTLGMSAQSGADKYYQNIENGYDPETSMKNALFTGALSF